MTLRRTLRRRAQRKRAKQRPARKPLTPLEQLLINEGLSYLAQSLALTERVYSTGMRSFDGGPLKISIPARYRNS